jgi:Ca2+-binding EF-hand superfamily protein
MKNLFKIIPLILVPVLSVTSIFSISAELPARGPIPFANYDRDGNGLISEQEFKQVRSERRLQKATQGLGMKRSETAPLFSTFDLNLDGQLTPEELSTGQQAQLQTRRGKAQGANMARGKNKGMRQGQSMPRFAKFDLNGDGVILEQEFNAARAARIKNRVEQGYSMKNIGNANTNTFADIDSDNDGKISSAEFTQHQASQRQQMMKK